jgi:hypothetical protein
VEIKKGREGKEKVEGEGGEGRGRRDEKFAQGRHNPKAGPACIN